MKRVTFFSNFFSSSSSNAGMNKAQWTMEAHWLKKKKQDKKRKQRYAHAEDFLWMEKLLL